MKKLILLFVLFSSPALADWAEVGTTKDEVILVDAQIVQITGPETLTMLAVYNQLEPRALFNRVYQSIVINNEYNCRTMHYRKLSRLYYKQLGANGDMVLNSPVVSKWLQVFPNTDAWIMFQHACYTDRPEAK